MSSKSKSTSALPSSNWLALQKKLKPENSHPRKKRKVQHQSVRAASVSTTATSENQEVATTGASSAAFPRGAVTATASTSTSVISTSRVDEIKNGESVEALRQMVLGESKLATGKAQTNKYIALDCEMVGVGLDGSESSLARVSMVNYYGEVLLDEFVQQRERVVDYRTEFSGIRPSDMVRAKPFSEIQKKVAELLKDRILVGHAVHNDMKALLLSHPFLLTRDTQVLAGKHKLTPSKRPALRVLVKQELGLTIQGGEHSSVVDARATMAVFRLHRKEWEKALPKSSFLTSASRKRPAPDDLEQDEDEDDEVVDRAQKKSRKSSKNEFPGGGRKGVSSGLSTVIKRKDASGKSSKSAWWKDLNG